MEHIVEAMTRNDKFKEGSDGQRLLELTTKARSNLNIDLENLDREIQRQFGLFSVEVIGDGVNYFIFLIKRKSFYSFIQRHVHFVQFSYLLFNSPMFIIVKCVKKLSNTF